MYNESANQSKSLAACEKTPYHIEVAEKALSDILLLAHPQQVEVFKHIQKKLCQIRYETCEKMKAEADAILKDVNDQQAGTGIIAAAI